ncbi:MAG: serpin family protein [Propionibacteriaceae bacterium]|nr:serpin family protein [Propionibacteriaceae bacterium]
MSKPLRLIAGATLLALTACSPASQPEEPDVAQGDVKGAVAVLGLPYETTPNVDEAARISQELAWRVIQNSSDPNRLTSPSSLSMSLAQAAEGARTVTLESIDGVLGLTGDARAKAFGALRQSLLQYEDLPASVDVNDPPETPVVHQASRVLAIDSTVEQPFLDRLAQFYDASASEAPRDQAKADLDAWANKHTAGLIPNSGIEVRPNTVAVLQDAVLFAAAWRTPFEHERLVPFNGGDVDGVSGIVAARYAEGDGWAAVRLPYDDNLAADVILPASGAPEALTVQQLEAAAVALNEAPEEQVRVTMPSFSLKSKTDLMKELPEIDWSDLGGIVPGSYGDQWVQQVVLQVSAKGTVGAAITELAAAESAPMMDHVFDVDRPYAFRVLDVRTGWPLFLATIGDPTA